MTQPITVMLRPVGSRCNLGCRDCYTGSGPDISDPTMSEEVLRMVVQSASVDAGHHQFILQGGEPLLAGVEWFAMLERIQREHGIVASFDHQPNAVQTNGRSLNYKWLHFLSGGAEAPPWHVGLSYNGPFYSLRPPLSEPQWWRIKEWSLEARQRGVPLSVLCVVDSISVQDPLITMRACEDFAEVISFAPAKRTTYEPDPELYANFLKFVREVKLPHITIGNFMNATATWAGTPEVCQLAPQCHSGITVDWNGDLYTCEWYMEPGDRIGNIRDMTLQEATNHTIARQKQHQSGVVRPECRTCEVAFGCFGGCPVEVHEGRNRYCEAHKFVARVTKPS